MGQRQGERIEDSPDYNKASESHKGFVLCTASGAHLTPCSFSIKNTLLQHVPLCINILLSKIFMQNLSWNNDSNNIQSL